MDNTTLSATVLIVLFSCILSNIITENAANALHQDEQSDNEAESRLMVMLTGSNTLQALMDTAITLYDKNSPTFRADDWAGAVSFSMFSVTF